MFKKEKIKDLHYVISGIITADEISKKSDSILEKYGSEAKIAGFRPGHIPLNVLRQKYGDSATQDAVNDLMNADLDTYIKEKKIRLAAAPKADLAKFVVGGDAEYNLEFDILPTVPKIELEKITLTKKVKTVSEKDIDAAVENIRKSHSHYNDKTDAGYKLVKDDVAVIDFTGFLGAEKFQGGEAKNHQLVLGSGQFIPGFEDQVIGHKLGDVFDVKVTFPENYHSADLAGKPVRFEVKVNGIKSQVPHELNDELAAHVGMESLAKMRDNIKTILETNANDTAQADMRNELLDALTDKVKLDLPESLVEQEFAAAHDQFHQNHGDHDHKHDGFDEKKERKDAERRVKLGLILADWGSESKITVSREELQRAIWDEAARYPNPQDVYEFYNKDKNALSMLNGMLFERKTLDKMIELCKVK